VTIHGLFPNDKRDVCARIVLFQNSLTGNWICVVQHGSTRVTGQMDPNGWSKANRGRIAGHAMSKQDHQGDEFDGHELQLFSQSAHSQDFMLLSQCLRPVTCARNSFWMRFGASWGLSTNPRKNQDCSDFRPERHQELHFGRCKPIEMFWLHVPENCHAPVHPKNGCPNTRVAFFAWFSYLKPSLAPNLAQQLAQQPCERIGELRLSSRHDQSVELCLL
jgi:hypothetical protein